MKKIISWVVGVLAVVCPYSLVRNVRRMFRYCHSVWLQREIAMVGDNVSLGRNLELIGGKYIKIGTATGMGDHGTLQAWDNYNGQAFNPLIVIGEKCWIGDYFNISSTNYIEIGNGVLTGRWVSIIDNSHGDSTEEDLNLPPLSRKLKSKGGIKIGDNVWIGDKVTILSGVTIGPGAIIGSNAVVTKDVPAGAVAVGVPAKIIKDYGI